MGSLGVWGARLGWAAVGSLVVGGSAGSYATMRDIGRGVRENAPLLIAVGGALLIYTQVKK